MASQLSGERPNAFESRNAIAGLIPLEPFRMRLTLKVTRRELRPVHAHLCGLVRDKRPRGIRRDEADCALPLVIILVQNPR